MQTERTARLSASPPLFASRFLDFFSRVHPVVPALIYIPVIAALVVLGARDGQGALEIIGAVSRVAWRSGRCRSTGCTARSSTGTPTIRSAIACTSSSTASTTTIPNDKMRLVMPPGASIPLAPLFFGVFWLVFGLPTAYPLFAGFLIGYLIYDYMHYYLHHSVPRTKLGKRLREQHMRHHFQDHRYGFGVSSPLWDAVFRTLPRTRRVRLTVTLRSHGRHATV